LDVDDQLGAFQLGFQARGLALQSSVFSSLRIGLAAPLRGHQALHFAALALVMPRG
jgi:hypothetical protein